MRKVINIYTGLLALVFLSGLSVTARTQAARGGSDSDSVATAQKTEIPESSIADEVIWIVGDEPILKSDVEMMRLQGEAEGIKWRGNPDCAIPEQLAVQKLFLHQAELDSIEVSESDVARAIDEQINRWIQVAGSREKLEEYRKESVSQMRQELHDEFKNSQLISMMKRNLWKTSP